MSGHGRHTEYIFSILPKDNEYYINLLYVQSVNTHFTHISNFNLT